MVTFDFSPRQTGKTFRLIHDAVGFLWDGDGHTTIGILTPTRELSRYIKDLVIEGYISKYRESTRLTTNVEFDMIRNVVRDKIRIINRNEDIIGERLNKVYVDEYEYINNEIITNTIMINHSDLYITGERPHHNHEMFIRLSSYNIPEMRNIQLIKYNKPIHKFK